MFLFQFLLISTNKLPTPSSRYTNGGLRHCTLGSSIARMIITELFWFRTSHIAPTTAKRYVGPRRRQLKMHEVCKQFGLEEVSVSFGGHTAVWHGDNGRCAGHITLYVGTG